MTGVALSWRCYHRGVVPRPGEGRCALVAGLAPYRRRDVVCRLTLRCRPVMASRTASHDPCVIKYGPGKRRGGLVTTLTGSTGHDVVRRFAHDPGVAPAMTGRAAGRDPLVIHRRPRPKGRRRFMAGLAP
jgi:hypothetical protein